MDRLPRHSLSVEQAKAQLREVARETGPRGWVREHPARAVALAFATGWLFAHEPRRAGRVLAAVLERLVSPEGARR